MQFHHHGYVSGDPRIQPAAGTGLNRSGELPEVVDVLIVGTGPAGMVAAAQLSRFPRVETRIVERRGGRLEVGQADGIQARSVETFQAFGFAEAITSEAYRICEMAFWKQDPDDPSHIVRTARAVDDATGVSEFPHLLVNQARVLDHFAEFMWNSPTRMTPDFGWEFVGLSEDEHATHPVLVTLRGSAGSQEGRARTVRARYVLGADGARSRVREAIGCSLDGDQANHAWGVMDVLARTDFPDIRLKCAIASAAGSILLIPREGGHLFRMYVDLGEVSEGRARSVRATSIEEIIVKAGEILRPYVLDVRHVAWHSVYEVGHRLAARFDDVGPQEAGTRTPRVFIAGDACHTHSAKAGQGMNVSMQDGFNLGWKLGHVLEGRSPEALLATYSAERQQIARDLIDFDKRWSSMMAGTPGEGEETGPTALEDFYVRTAEFPAGFMTEYPASLVVGEATHQALAPGFTLGKRFKSPRVVRVCDANPVHLGHLAQADGRWRIYVFAARSGQGRERLAVLSDWLLADPASPYAVVTAEAGPGAWFDTKVVLPVEHTEVDLMGVPDAFRPEVGPFALVDLENVFAVDPRDDVFSERGLHEDGVVVVVRPDQYVAAVVPLDDPAALGAFFAPLRKG